MSMWYALQVKTGYELEIADLVERMADVQKFQEPILDVFAGVKKIVQITTRGRRKSDEAVMRGYIFVKIQEMTNHMWHFLKELPGVFRILDWLPVKETEIETMVEQCRGEVEIRVEEAQVQINNSELVNHSLQENTTEEESSEQPMVVQIPDDASLNQTFVDVQGRIYQVVQESATQQSENVVEEKLADSLLRFFKKGTKMVFRIPIYVYKALLEYDKTLSIPENERKPQYILSSITRFIGQLRSERCLQ